jgi:hypothetical protein
MPDAADFCGVHQLGIFKEVVDNQQTLAPPSILKRFVGLRISMDKRKGVKPVSGFTPFRFASKDTQN